MDVVKLTKKSVSIPSYVDKKNNEKEIGEFVFNYLKKFTFLMVERQFIGGGRFNIIARTKGKPRLFFAGHLDTVQPKQGWTIGQFSGKIVKNKLFGIGSLDTKSGIAALLDAIKDFKDISGLIMLFYCDEEYDFKGMKRFIKSNKKKIGDLAIFIEPTDLKICKAHRGLVEIKFIVRGKTGHAKNSKKGKNAILASAKAIAAFEKYIALNRNKVLGESAMNIAYIHGGLNLGENKKKEVILGKEGNNIADYAEFVIDIRPATKALNAKNVINFFQKEIKRNGCILEDWFIRHDYSCLYTDTKDIKNIIKTVKKSLGEAKILKPELMGYAEAPLVQEKFKIPVIYFGPSGKNSHGANEHVNIDSIKKTREVYKNIISSLI